MGAEENRLLYAEGLVKSFGGNLEHTLNCVDRLHQSAESEEQKRHWAEIKTLITNQGNALKAKVGRVTKKKQLIWEVKLLDTWKNFLGENYQVELGNLVTTQGKDEIQRVVDNYATENTDGVLFIEYTNKKTGEKSVLLQGEWFVQVNDVIRHLTPYVMANYSRYYDEYLNLKS